jgi:hypothetical protein
MKEDIEKIFNYPVVRVPLEELLDSKKYESLPYTQNFTFVKTPKKDILIGVGSKKYNLLPCNELFSSLENKLSNYYKFTKIYKQQDYCKFYVDYIFEDKEIFMGADKIKLKPCIKITHSYNGYLKYNIYFGFFDPKYSNFLYGFKMIKGTPFKPTLENLDKIIEETIFYINDFLERTQELLIDKYFPLNQHFFKNWEEEVINLSNLIIFPKKLTKIIINNIKEEIKVYNCFITNWELYNNFIKVLNNTETKLFEEKKLSYDNEIYTYLKTYPKL